MGAKLYTFSGRFHKICDKITLNEKKTSIKGAILSIEALKTMPAGRVQKNTYNFRRMLDEIVISIFKQVSG